MARFILVHGAWHGGWCWEEVVPRLRALGHDVRAPDLPGMGADAGSGHVATLDEWAMFVAGMASAADEPAILVGHSRGGIVVSRAAELAPHAVSRLVYLAAVMVLPGQTMFETFGMTAADRGATFDEAIRPAEDGRTTLWHNAETALRSFYNTSPPDRARAAFARLTPEPSNMGPTPVVLSEARYGSIPRSYIRCERDAAVPIELQQRMVDAQPCPTASLDTDHSPFYSAPEALTKVLDGLAR